MNLDDKNIKQLRQLILFTIVILIALWNYDIIFGWIGFAFGIIFPFLLGGAIAFVLNVPMNFLEEKIFRNKYLKDKKTARKLARPVSLVLTIAIVIGVVVLVMFIVIPELTQTVLSLGRTIRAFVPDAQRFLEELFKDNSEISEWLEGLNLNVNQLVNQAVSFFQNGAGGHAEFHDVGDRFDRKRRHHICDRICVCMLCPAAERKAACAGHESNVCVYA